MIFDKEKQAKYRHELKYVCTAAQLALIQSRIHHLIPLDSHAGKNGMYTIRSLYFDDYYNRCYQNLQWQRGKNQSGVKKERTGENIEVILSFD